MILHILAVLAGLAFLIPTAWVVLTLAVHTLWFVLSGGLPDWVEQLIICLLVVASAVTGGALIYWGVTK